MFTVPVEGHQDFEFGVKEALGLIVCFYLAAQAAFLSFIGQQAHELS